MQSQFLGVKSTTCHGLWKGLTWPEGLCTQTCQDDEHGKAGGVILLIGRNQLVLMPHQSRSTSSTIGPIIFMTCRINWSNLQTNSLDAGEASQQGQFGMPLTVICRFVDKDAGFPLFINPTVSGKNISGIFCMSKLSGKQLPISGKRTSMHLASNFEGIPTLRQNGSTHELLLVVLAL